MSTECIVLGGGCFWCIEAVYARTPGITATRSGYAGGSVQHPTYRQVCSGTTGHAEVVKVSFDPQRIALADVLDLFWRAHDPTTLNRQGGDVGTQYRSIVLYRDAEQERIVRAGRDAAQRGFTDPIVTDIEPLGEFYPAEDYHNDYYEHNAQAGYCRVVIQPKIEKLGLDSAPLG